jgi:O-antigen ligase
MIRVILWMLVLGNVLTVVDGFNIPDLGIIQQRDDGRLGGPMGESNQYGALLALTLPPLIALLWDPQTKKAAAVAAIFVSFLALLVAGSRGSFVGVILGGAFAAFWLRSVISMRYVVFGAAVSAVVVTVTLALFLQTQLFENLVGRLIEQTAAGDIYRVSSGRSDIWRFALERMLETPLSFVTGFGWNAYDSMRGFNAAPHSVYLATMFNLGLPGLVLYLLFVYAAFATALRAVPVASGIVRTHLAAFVFGFAALCISVAFVDLYQPWVYIWAYVGVVMRLAIEATRGSEASVPKAARPLSLVGAARL